MAKIVTGLDIGTESIKLVQIRRNRGDTATVIASAEIEIPQIPETAGGTSPVADALKKLLAQSKIHPVNLVTAVPKQSVVVRYIKLPTNSVNEVQQMIRFEAAKYVPFFTDQDIVDFELIGSSPMGGSDVLLVVSRRSLVEEHITLLRSLHLEPYSADVSSLALVRGLRQAYPALSKEQDKAHLVIDLGANLMELSLVQNHTLRYTRTATIAGSQLIKTLQDDLDISSQEARSLITKLDYGKPDFGIEKYPHETVEQSVNSWLERLDNEIKRSIDYFASEFGVTQLQSIILNGGLARLPFLKEHLEKEIGVPAFVANLLESSKGLSPQFNTAYGLALRKLDAPLGAAINLLPPEILGRRIARKKKNFALQIGIGVLVLLIAGVVFGYRQYVNMELQIHTIDRELLQKKPLADKLADMKHQIDSLNKMISKTDIGIEALAGISQISSVPTRVTLERFTYERYKNITLTAVAMSMEDAVDFRPEVEKIGLFDTVRVQNVNTDVMEGKPIVRCQVICKLKKSKNQEDTGDSGDSGESSPDQSEDSQ